MTGFGKMIKRRRVEAGKSIEDVASELGCSAMTVRRYESGSSLPQMDRAVALMKFLDIDMLEGVRAVGGDL